MEMSIEGIDRHSIADALSTHDPLVFKLLLQLTPVSQMEVGAHGGPGAAIVIAPQGARTPNWPPQTRNPATSPPRQAP